MPYNRKDLCRDALVEIGVLSGVEEMLAPDFVDVKRKFDSMFAGLIHSSRGFPFTWVPDDVTDTIPDEAFSPLVKMTAYEISRQFGVAPDMAMKREGMADLRAFAFPDDRTPDDLDDDGTVTTDEIAASNRARYY